MAYYHDLNRYPVTDDIPEDPAWIAARLVALRQQLRTEIKDKRRPNSLIIGSWNLQAFDGGRPRLSESYHYIAEIIDHFDICALQEIKPDLGPLKRLLRLLGPNWDYFVTDVNTQDDGNSERTAFVFNKNKVQFRNLIGEIVLDASIVHLPRSPFFAAFQAGWFKFVLCTTHVVFGDEDDLASRAREVRAVADALSARAKAEDQVFVLLGDLNITNHDDEIMAALRAGGFEAPDLGATNLGGTNHFDHIAFSDPDTKTRFLNAASFDWRGSVFRNVDMEHYRPIAAIQRDKPQPDFAGGYRRWMSFEMSDHLPVWMELEVDYSDEYLGRFIPSA